MLHPPPTPIRKNTSTIVYHIPYVKCYVMFTFDRQISARFAKTEIVLGSAREFCRIFDERFLNLQYIAIISFKRLIIRIVIDQNIIFVPCHLCRFAFHATQTNCFNIDYYTSLINEKKRNFTSIRI